MNGWNKDGDDLISRQEAISALGNAGLINYAATGSSNGLIHAMNVIKGLPTAQPERKKGKWVEVTDGTCIWKVCDQCGEKPLWNEWRTDRCESDFCPNCGADMRDEQDG